MAAKKLLDELTARLAEAGIPVESIGPVDLEESGVKVLCLAGKMGESVEAMAEVSRDQVVMVRLDRSAVSQLDAWVETGVLKSRSEAAALFIREGLSLRSGELDELRTALADVQAAKSRLAQIAHKVLGTTKPDGEDADEDA